jgi:hypothetical protein
VGRRGDQPQTPVGGCPACLGPDDVVTMPRNHRFIGSFGAARRYLLKIGHMADGAGSLDLLIRVGRREWLSTPPRNTKSERTFDRAL